MSKVRIADRLITPELPPYFVAELSGNHQQSLDKAKALIEASVEAGADAVKLQTYTPDTITLPVKTDLFKINDGLWAGHYLHDLYGEAMTPWEWHKPLAQFAQELGVVLFSSPFDETAVDYLEAEINPPVYKIASFEINHIPLLKKVGQTKKPVILSTGMATEADITLALKTLTEAGASGVVLLKCVSSYPSDPSDFNLKSLDMLRECFNCPVGLSDHSLSHEIALGSVALGATLIEKHIVLSRAEGGIDSGFSLEPQEFAEMVTASKRLHQGLGQAVFEETVQERGQSRFRRSIFVSTDIREGEAFTVENIKVVRPSNGLDPVYWEGTLGKKAARGLTAGSPLVLEDILSE